jgi:hypothetical protein
MFANKFLQKRNIFCGMPEKRKKRKKNIVNCLIGASKIVFLHKLQKILFFIKSLCVNIECPDVHTKFCSDFFLTFYNVFLDNGCIYFHFR